jgi:hypothetical protein
MVRGLFLRILMLIELVAAAKASLYDEVDKVKKV